MKYRKLSEDQKKFLCFQYINGKTIEDLSKEWDVALGTVHNILRQHGIKARPKGKSFKMKKHS